jgi:para-nitrobenzyl esterase
MSSAWLAFARTGDPNGPGIPSWPPYDAKRRATLVFDLESRVIDDPFDEVRTILQRV